MSLCGAAFSQPRVRAKHHLLLYTIVYSVAKFSPVIGAAPDDAEGDGDGDAVSGGSGTSSNASEGDHGGGAGAVVHVATVHYEEVRDPLIFTLVVLLTALCKVVYHHVHFLSSKVPESCILVLIGVLFGAAFEFSGVNENLPTFFSPHQFFLFLLPPITLEAAYSLHDRTLLENIGSILLFAILGTVVACLVIGFSMYGLAQAGGMGDIVSMSLMEYLVFAALIVAVDPVAVLAVFSEIGVNNVLYFLVFGESLLNDGVTVVLYSVFQELKMMDEIGAFDVFLGVIRFLVVCLGGLALGVLAGLVTAVITKYTTHVKVIEPIIIFAVAYTGFLLSELFTFSGIISMIGCGLTQKQYAFENISDRARSSVNYFSKVISNINEIIIFLFLGISIMSNDLKWHTGFALWAIVLCLLFRFIITYIMAFFINKNGGLRKITFPEQFMIAYGGLRGAVCFSLVALLEERDFPQKDMFVTSSFAVILFTVFVQGISIKPLVYGLRIRLNDEKDETMFEELSENVTDQVMTALEQIIGDHGHNHMRERLRDFDAKYLKPLLLAKTKRKNAQLHMFYENLLLREHYKHLELSGAKTDNIDDLYGIDSDLILRSLASEEDEDDYLSETESIPSTDQDTGYGNSPDSQDLAAGRGLFFPGASALDHHRRGSMFPRSSLDSARRLSISLLNHHNNHLHHHHHQNNNTHDHHKKNSLTSQNSAGTRGSEDLGDRIIPAVTVVAPTTIDIEGDSLPPGPVARNRSMSLYSGSETVGAHDLRELIHRNQRNQMDAWKARYDPDMHMHADLPEEIKSKSSSNRRLSLMPGHADLPNGSGGVRRRRKSSVQAGNWTRVDSIKSVTSAGSGSSESGSKANTNTTSSIAPAAPTAAGPPHGRRPSGTGVTSHGEKGSGVPPAAANYYMKKSRGTRLSSLSEEGEDKRMPLSTTTEEEEEEGKLHGEEVDTSCRGDNSRRREEESQRLTSAADSSRRDLAGVDNPALDRTSDSSDVSMIEIRNVDPVTCDPALGSEVTNSEEESRDSSGVYTEITKL